MKPALLALVIMFAAGSATAQQAYRSGVTAYTRGRFAETVSAMKDAIAERPAESAETVLIYGTWYEPYVPHYYLGMSLAKIGRCAEALPELEASRRQAVMPRKYVAGLDQAVTRCKAALPQPIPPARTETATTTIAPPVVTVTTETAAITVTSPPPPVIVTTAPVTATSDPQSGKALAASRESLANATKRARKALVEVPKTAAPKQAALLEMRIRRAESIALSGSADRVAAAARDLITATDDFAMATRSRGAVAELPPPLLTGVDAYLRGDYAAALDALRTATFTDERSRAQALLFRAAASHALYVLGHERDRDLYARAAADIVEYKRLHSQRSPDARVFSPAFLQFVETR